MNFLYLRAALLLCCFYIYPCTCVRAQLCGSQVNLPADIRYDPVGFLNDEINTGFVVGGAAPVTANSFAVPVSESGQVVGCAVQAEARMINGNNVFVFDNVFVTRAEDCYQNNPFGFAPSATQIQDCQADPGQTEGLITVDNTGNNNYEGFYFVIYDPANGGQYFRADNAGAAFSGTSVSFGFFGGTSNEVPPANPSVPNPATTITTGSASFNSFAAATGNAAGLPVEFLRFSGRLRGKVVELGWATATETDNAGFTVERLDADGEFAAIGEVAGAGTSFAVNDYVFADEAPRDGANVYRLRQRDFSGTFAFSAIISVDVENGGDRLDVFPNPTNGPINVRFAARSGLEYLRLVDAAGREVLRRELAKDTESLRIETAQLVPGVYSLTANSHDGVVSRRVVIR